MPKPDRKIDRMKKRGPDRPKPTVEAHRSFGPGGPGPEVKGVYESIDKLFGIEQNIKSETDDLKIKAARARGEAAKNKRALADRTRKQFLEKYRSDYSPAEAYDRVGSGAFGPSRALYVDPDAQREFTYTGPRIGSGLAPGEVAQPNTLMERLRAAVERKRQRDLEPRLWRIYED